MNTKQQNPTDIAKQNFSALVNRLLQKAVSNRSIAQRATMLANADHFNGIAETYETTAREIQNTCIASGILLNTGVGYNRQPLDTNKVNEEVTVIGAATDEWKPPHPGHYPGKR